MSGLFRMDIVRASELNAIQIDQAFTLFVEGFYPIFSQTVTKDIDILHELFKDSFDYQMVYTCLCNDMVVGFLGLGNSQKRPVSFKKETCQKLFGRSKGYLIYKQMGAMLTKTKVNDSKEGYIDYLTTDINFRGYGVATQLIQYICDNLSYEQYSLEVFSKNVTAKTLYEKLGFKQIKLMNNPFTIINGFGKSITMKLQAK